MPRHDANGPVTLSVLDRLIDDDPKHSSEAPLTRAQSLRELKVALKRDLEWLFNTRRTIDPAPEFARETLRSVYHYGFVDISSRSLHSSRDHADLAAEMESALAFFEPRLKRVKVRLEPQDDKSRTLRFGIEGLLCLDPAPVPVRFDTVLELGKGTYEVKGEELA
jgi:type VI secretion system protein ImpF